MGIEFRFHKMKLWRLLIQQYEYTLLNYTLPQFLKTIKNCLIMVTKMLNNEISFIGFEKSFLSDP